MGTRYIAGKLFIPGSGWKGKSPPGQKLTTEEKREIETEAKRQYTEGSTREDQEMKSAEIYRLIANEVLPKSIRMKEDVPSNHLDGLLLILDTKMRITSSGIEFHHYTKPMASMETVLARSAMSMSMLISQPFKKIYG